MCAVGLVRLTQYSLHRESTIDQLLFASRLVGGGVRNRMAPNTASSTQLATASGEQAYSAAAITTLPRAGTTPRRDGHEPGPAPPLGLVDPLERARDSDADLSEGLRADGHRGIVTAATQG